MLQQAITPAPLPGDLVICTRPASQVMWCYAVAVWPHLERTGPAYATYEDALVRARAHARVKAVSVWRNHSLDPQQPVFEHVSANESTQEPEGHQKRRVRPTA
jgi:hypothetical protein